ncbi:hypothetical protein E0L36_22470 [Streptomyces sp. AJS327]|uniref:hypothetical protein n=1 Tax=Streptomyces sp. AJS327 TaxID=2545265 RepID=UPI0015DEAEB0|nr:hypothetical protein [Streptomyces sp. AJS327]MBA0053541.1 hypothetical protein [Streptomyces sp. AJS327]
MKLDIVSRDPAAAPAALTAIRLLALLPERFTCHTEVATDRVRLRVETSESLQSVGEAVAEAVRDKALHGWRLAEVEL